MPDAVKVTGLKELVRELKKLDDAGLVAELKDANYKVAELVVGRAQGNTSTPMESRAAASLKPGRQAAKAVVSGGGAAVPFFGGAEFGAGQNKMRNTARGAVRGWNQFVPWTGQTGRFLYPTIRAESDNIVEMYGDAIEKITSKAFPD